MHPGMNSMNMMGQNSGPMHGNMMPSGVMGPTSNMNKLVMQVGRKFRAFLTESAYVD